MKLTAKHREYWNKNLTITSILLTVWFFTTFVVGWFSRELNSIVIAGFPFGFYMNAQGSLIIFVALTWYYQHYMNKLDKEYGVQEGDSE